MAGNCSETVVQLDGQEQPIEMEQRHVITAVRKFSALAKGSASRTGKPFFPTLTKLSNNNPVIYHPWPSTVNISHSAPVSMPIEEGNPWRKDSFKSFRQSSIDDSEGRQPSISSQSNKSQEGVVNSAFTEEKLHDVPDICDCDKEEYNNSGSPHQRDDSYQHSQIPEPIDMPVIGGEPSRASSPKYLIKRNQSISDSKKKKSIQWPKLSGKALKFRRRTTDNVPVIGTMMSRTSSSSPNLRNLEERKTARSVKIDSSCKQEDDSKLWMM